MKYREFGNRNLPTIIMLHGGGLSWWSLKKIANKLKRTYHVVTPIIDGHGEEGETTFVSIEESSQKIIDYIDNTCNGKVFAICGLSIGGQIILEVISQNSYITEYAVVESALVYPMKLVSKFITPMYRLFYGLIKKKWFAKLQARSLFVPDEMFEQYYQDSLKISKKSFINMTLSNLNFKLKTDIIKTEAKVLIIVGSKELKIIKKSAKKLHNTIKNSRIYIAENMGHGEISLKRHREYLDLLENFFGSP